MERIRLGVVIPTFDQRQMLMELLNSFETVHQHRFFIIDNSIQDLSVPVSWNRGIQAAMTWGADRVLVCSDDVLLHPTTVDRLVERSLTRGYGLICPTDVRQFGLGSPQQLPHFVPPDPGKDQVNADYSCFLIAPRFYYEIGPFDEQIQRAYWEDSDYNIRIRLAGQQYRKTTYAVHWHFGNATRHHAGEQVWWTNRNYLYHKWGRIPGALRWSGIHPADPFFVGYPDGGDPPL